VSGGTLLVADDEPQNLDLIRMVVEEADVEVRLVTASNGQEAVRLARDFAPRLVLMDLKMPILDGWEATRRLKADPATRSIPIIAVSAQAMAGDRERALAAGCDDYIAKPIDVGSLVALLRQRLR
jgi:two-component system cell cycle response regulator DivK